MIDQLENIKYTVQAVILNEDGEVLSVSRKHDHNDFGLVGGKVDDTDTSNISALVREIKEETGLDVKEKNLYKIFQIYKDGYMSMTYLCTDYSGDIETDEPHVVSWLPFYKIIKGSFGLYNRMVYECLVNMGIEVKLNSNKFA